MRFKATYPSEALMILPASSTDCALFFFRDNTVTFKNCTFTLYLVQAFDLSQMLMKNFNI